MNLIFSGEIKISTFESDVLFGSHFKRLLKFYCTRWFVMASSEEEGAIPEEGGLLDSSSSRCFLIIRQFWNCFPLFRIFRIFLLFFGGLDFWLGNNSVEWEYQQQKQQNEIILFSYTTIFK